MTSPDLQLDVYGLPIAVSGWPAVVQDLRQDFAWFDAGGDGAARLAESGGGPPSRVGILIEERDPAYEGLPDLPASFVTPRNTVYQDGHRTVVDYSGRGLAVFDRNARLLTVQGTNRHLVHEIVYLFMLSQVGDHLDAAGLTRLHALGLVGAQGAVAVLLPAGGGKSTLALRALREPGVRLLSDDTPLLDRHGNVHAFPLRIGVGPEAVNGFRPDQIRLIERLEYPAKHVVSIEAFSSEIETRPQRLAHIVVAHRRLGRTGRLEPLPRHSAGAALFRDGVVGLGVAQMLEWVLQRGIHDVLGKTGVAAGRMRCCWAALARARTWRLEMGRDHERNWQALAPLLA